MNAVGFKVFRGIEGGIDHKIIRGRAASYIFPHFKTADHIYFISQAEKFSFDKPDRPEFFFGGREWF